RLATDPVHPGALARRARRELRLDLPRPAPARSQGLREGALGDVGEQPPGALLRADRRGPPAARGRAFRVGALGGGARPHPRRRVMLRGLLVRLRALLRRSSVEAELDEELRYHLERDAERSGGAAAPAFGNLGVIKEEVRDSWSWAWLEHLAMDL